MIKSSLTYTTKVFQVSKLESISLPKAWSNDITYEVKIYKITQNAKPSLAVCLHVPIGGVTPDAVVAASFQLLSFRGEGQPIVKKKISPYVFDASDNDRCVTLISWSDLFDQDKRFVENDTLHLKIKIAVANPERSRLLFECIQKSCDDCNFGKYRLTVTNIRDLMAAKCSQFTWRGLSWDIIVCKTSSSELAVMLRLKENAGIVLCQLSVKLISTTMLNAPPVERSVTQQYQYLENHTYLALLSWNDMVRPENGFVNNNAITLEVEIKSSSVCFKCIANRNLGSIPCDHLYCLECTKKRVPIVPTARHATHQFN